VLPLGSPGRTSPATKAVPPGLVGWLAFWAAFAVLDLLVTPSLSDTTRRTFHTDTPLGAAVFTVALVVGSCVLWAHILKGK
jgi:hypothetical protein